MSTDLVPTTLAAAGSVTISGTVTTDPTDDPARQLGIVSITGPVTATISGTVSTDPARPSTATVSEVAASDVAVQLAAALAGRLGLLVYNDSPEPLAVKYGTGADPRESLTMLVAPGGAWTMPEPLYRGIVTGAWRSADPSLTQAQGFPSVSGSAFVTELTA